MSAAFLSKGEEAALEALGWQVRYALWEGTCACGAKVQVLKNGSLANHLQHVPGLPGVMRCGEPRVPLAMRRLVAIVDKP